MVERGCHALLSDRLFKKPGMREKAEEMLRSRLSECANVVLSEPEYRLIAPDRDSEQQWEPYWAWEITAVGR